MSLVPDDPYPHISDSEHELLWKIALSLYPNPNDVTADSYPRFSDSDKVLTWKISLSLNSISTSLGYGQPDAKLSDPEHDLLWKMAISLHEIAQGI